MRKIADWDVDIRKPDSGIECWVADTRDGNTLACRPLKSPASSSIMEVLEGAIRAFGRPSSIRTDCGAQFTSQEFRGFLASRGIAHRVAYGCSLRLHSLR